MRAGLTALASLLALFMFPSFPAQAAEPVPRTVIALYGGGDVQNSYIHTVAEMPLNHLGIILEYHDIHEPLPDIAHREDVRGVLTWFMSGSFPPDIDAYLKWAVTAQEAGKKFVIMGVPGIFSGKGQRVNSALASRFLAMLGMKMADRWVDRPFAMTYSFETPSMFLATAPYEWLRPPLEIAQSLNSQNRVHMRAFNKDRPENGSDVIVTGPGGGYAADGYIFRSNMEGTDEVVQWLLNPFEFFRLALDTDEVPKPDTTTIAGRRIYYSSIDGDGFNNVTQIADYQGKNVLCTKVVLDRVIKQYPDMPVMLAIIGADIDPAWSATKDSRDVARQFLAQPQVEAGTHTYSHPFDWQFFEKNDPKTEIPYLHVYQTPVWKPTPEELQSAAQTPKIPLPNGYTVPRAYASEPFDIHKEIEGSIKEISELLPPGKKVDVVAWPGNCSPWEDVVRMTRDAHIENINGGDSRSDPANPSYASEAPIARQVGNERQIYNATSSEEIYTNLWSANFNAFEYLKKTLRNTETPIRVKPISIYYHLYSGEKEASLRALISNVEYAHAQNIAPITVSRFSRIANGFFDAKLSKLGPDTWQVDTRGELQTIRFDHRSLQSVDFTRSKGVIGQRYLQGSLYVYLDATEEHPVIALQDDSDYFPSHAPVPYLIESRWLISDMHYGHNDLDFTAQGFGTGEMVWQMPAAGSYRVSIDGDTHTWDALGGRLVVKLPAKAVHPVHIIIKAS